LTITTPVPVAGREYVVPEITREPPGVRVVPGATAKTVCPDCREPVTATPLMVRTEGGDVIWGFGVPPRVEVCPFITTAEPVAGRLKVVPEITAVPPGVRVWPGPRTKAVLEPETLAVIGTPLTVMMGAPVAEGPVPPSVCVTPLIMATEPPGARLRVVPETTIGGPPGVSVTPGATTKPPDGFAVIVEPPTVRTGDPGALTAIVLLPPMTMFPPPAGRETGTPLMVTAWPG
jgi:hypothetical protein